MPRKRRQTVSAGEMRSANGRGRSRTVNTAPRQERAYLVGLDHGQNTLMSAEQSLRELARLARTAGATVVGQTLQRRRRPDPGTYIGSGKLRQIQDARASTDYSLVVFDEQLAPAQQLRLESALNPDAGPDGPVVKVMDRSALILDIFASRARTREAALQVELAQHEYLLPRLRGQWQHLERTEGAIGARGPGETQLETDRRLVGGRVARLKREIERVRKQRALHRRRRERGGAPVVALVGYTNSGKSSLMRALAGADVLVADALFATLDPITRRIGTPDSEAAFLLTDTVGFIQKLPAALVAAFRATLEELASAALLLHIVDVAHEAVAAQSRSVLQTLDELGLSKIPVLTVLNKADQLALPNGQPVERESDLDRLVIDNPTPGGQGTVIVSALQGWRIDALRERIAGEVLGAGAAAAAGRVAV